MGKSLGHALSVAQAQEGAEQAGPQGLYVFSCRKVGHVKRQCPIQNSDSGKMDYAPGKFGSSGIGNYWVAEKWEARKVLEGSEESDNPRH